MDLNDILILVITLVIGFFLRDFYGYLKEKLIKPVMPKVLFEYIIRNYSEQWENPRLFHFKGIIILQNIDSEPIYNIYAYKKNNKNDIIIKAISHLKPDEKKEIEEHIKVSIEDGNVRTGFDVARLKIPNEKRNPRLVLKFENSKGKKYSKELKIPKC